MEKDLKESGAKDYYMVMEHGERLKVVNMSVHSEKDEKKGMVLKLTIMQYFVAIMSLVPVVD